MTDWSVTCDGFSQRPVITPKRLDQLSKLIRDGGRSAREGVNLLAEWESEATQGLYSVDWDCDFEGSFSQVDGYIKNEGGDRFALRWTCPDCHTEHDDGPWARAELDGTV